MSRRVCISMEDECRTGVHQHLCVSVSTSVWVYIGVSGCICVWGGGRVSVCGRARISGCVSRWGYQLGG